VLLINYIRYPLPPSSLSGISEELGGVRFYYDKIIMFIFFISIAYRSEIDLSFIRKVFGILVLMTSIANIIGIILYVYPNFDNIFASLYNNRIFSNSFFNGSLGRSIDPLTNAVRINVFWGTAIGFFILISNVIKPKPIIKIILLSLYAVGILLSATRSFFFGIIIALIIWAFLSKNKKLMYIFIVVAILGLIVQTVSSFSPQINRLFYFPSDTDKLTTSRIDLFNIYWNDFRKNILFGVGVGATEIPKAASAQAYFFLVNLRFGGHGFFLGSLYTMGIIGLLPFLMLYYKALRVSYKLYKRPSAEFDKLTGMLCIMFIGYSLIPFMVGGIETYNQFFLLIGIIAGLYMKLQRDNATI
jgi:O-antigen ligase